jgi:hypothetical protein
MGLFFSCSSMQEYEKRRQARLQPAKNIETTPTTPIEVPELTEPEDPYKGLIVPSFSQKARTKDNYEQVLASYTGFVETAELVSVAVKNQGLAATSGAVQRVRLGIEKWRSFFAGFQVIPAADDIKKTDLEAIYAVLSDLDRRVQKTIDTLNALIDAERTRPWVTLPSTSTSTQ